MFFYGWTAVVPPSVLFSTAKTNKDMNTNPTSNMNTNIWTALEIGTGAIPSVWRERAGDQFFHHPKRLPPAAPGTRQILPLPQMRLRSQCHHLRSRRHHRRLRLRVVELQ